MPSSREMIAACSSALVGDHRGSARQHGLPIGIRHRRDDDLAVAELGEIFAVTNDPHRTGRDLRSDALAGHPRRRRCAEVEDLEGARRATRVDGLGAGLHDEQLAAPAVLGPLDVHRRREVALDRDRPACEPERLVVGERAAATLGRRNVEQRGRAVLSVD
jgi:hypothetical protein